MYNENLSTQKIAEAVSDFGESFAELFNKYSKAQDGEDDSPTLSEVKKKYSEEAILFWIRFNIAEALVFLGLFDSVKNYQVQEASRLILRYNPDLTLNGFLSFLSLIKYGKYGKITSVHELCVALNDYDNG